MSAEQKPPLEPDSIDDLPPDDFEKALAETMNGGPEALRRALAQAETFTPMDLKCAALNKSDVGNAERLALRKPDEIMYVDGVGWHGWDGTHWNFQRGRVIAHQAAIDVHKKILNEARALYEAGRYPNENPKDFEKRIAAHASWYTASGNAHRLKAMIETAAAHVTRYPEDLDADDELFACANGTLDLSDIAHIKRRPAKPAHLITRVSPVKYDPKATCPKFNAFLAEILPDPEVRMFVQVWSGYLLSGKTTEQALSLWYGKGANGKSTLAAILQFILGEYSKTIGFASLLRDDKRRGSEASPDMARLRGARAAFAGEPEHNVQFSEGLVKQVTGEDPITARFLNKEFFEYVPKFKLTLFFNNKPTVRGTDEGIWRRMRLVPFLVTIPKERRNKKLINELKDEAPGILNWMLDGYRAWREKGLPTPAAVVEATAAYREESDNVGAFITAATTTSGQAATSASTLFAAYQHWAKANAMFAVGQTLFGRRMSESFSKGRDAIGRVVYLGVSLNPDWEPHRHGDPGAPPEHHADAPPPEEEFR